MPERVTARLRRESTADLFEIEDMVGEDVHQKYDGYSTLDHFRDLFWDTEQRIISEDKEFQDVLEMNITGWISLIIYHANTNRCEEYDEEFVIETVEVLERVKDAN